MNQATEREAYIGFSVCPGIGPLRFQLLVKYFGKANDAWGASKETLEGLGLGQKLTAQLDTFRHSFNPAEFQKETQKKEITIVTRIDSEYPEKLHEIPDPPIALYVKGNLNLRTWSMAVVGTRKPTTYGREITRQLTRDLALAGFTIVSGLARGVDGIAHRTALETHAHTIAVLGCGVDIIYPPEHRSLYTEIIETGGAVISEVPPGVTVARGLFPARNRIISGISHGVLVTEGAEDSGSLITARFAADQGRDVFAIPGPITSYLSRGPTNLIRQGAKVVTGIADILEEYHMRPATHTSADPKLNSLTPEEKTIVELLRAGEIHFDEIVRLSRLSASRTGALLSLLELDGIIQNSGNGKYGLK